MELPVFSPLDIEFLSEKEKLVRRNTNFKFKKLFGKNIYNYYIPAFLRTSIHLTSEDGVHGLYYLKFNFASIYLKLKSSLNLFTNKRASKCYNLPVPSAFL